MCYCQNLIKCFLYVYHFIYFILVLQVKLNNNEKYCFGNWNKISLLNYFSKLFWSDFFKVLALVNNPASEHLNSTVSSIKTLDYFYLTFMCEFVSQGSDVSEADPAALLDSMKVNQAAASWLAEIWAVMASNVWHHSGFVHSRT